MDDVIEKASFVKLGINSKTPLSTHINWQNEKCSYDKVRNHKGNLGVATGKISNFLQVVDWDFRLGLKEEGFKIIYKEYEKIFPRLSKTKIVSTPHGVHFYYVLKGVNYPNTSQKNGGYSNTLKTFIGSNSVRFGKYLKGFDSRGDGGYVVIPPSEVGGLKYEWFNDNKPIEITDEEYRQIFDFFKEKDVITHTMRKSFVDMAIGKLNPQEYKQDTGLKEHVYWKEFYHEVHTCLGLLPEDLLDGLEKNNKGFSRDKTLKQLSNSKNIDYILNGKRMSKEKYKEYFPKYIQTTNNNNIFQEEKTLKQLLSFLTKESTTEEIKRIFLLVPEKDIIKIEDVCKEVKRKRGISLPSLRALYKLTHSEEKERLKQVKVNSDDIFEFDDDDDEGVFCSYEYKRGTIENREDGVYFCTTTDEGFTIEEPVLISPIRLIHKTKSMNRDLFSYEFRGDIYNTQSRNDILMELEVFRTGGDRGRDVLKVLITKMGDELEYKGLEPIMGFNNKWVFPQLQEENNYRILITTDLQTKIYRNCKQLFSDEFDIKEIQKKLREFLFATEMDKGKIAMIIGWSIAQLFRLSFLEYFYFAPDLLLTGDPQTGKTAFSKVVITDFYKAWKKPLQGAQIATKSSFEDACSTSTFPILVDELEYIDYRVVDPMKARATDIPDFSRKTSAKEMFIKPEVAGFCITTNTIPKAFYNNALIERLIVINYSSKEVIMEKQGWNNISRELRKLNLFSPIYDFTKDWNNEDVFKKIESIQKYCPLFTFDARLRKKYIFIFFGLTLFSLIFGIDLTPDLKLSLFEQSGRIITGDLLNDFQNFCNIAINYDVGTTSQSGIPIRGDNPKFITCALEPNTKGNYIFNPNNLRDFKEFISNKKYNIRSLSAQLNKSIGKKDYFYYGGHSLDGITITSIKIPHDFNEQIKKIKKNI